MGQDRAKHPLIALALLWAADAASTPTLGSALASAIGCAGGRADEIVICRRTAPSERDRIPLDLRPNGFDFAQEAVDGVSRERHRLMEGGENGIGSCSASGAAGSTGCLVRQFRAWEQQRAGH